MSDDTKKRGTRRGTRWSPYMDPNVCPRCTAKATITFGARRYCTACHDEMTAYVESVRNVC